jgi:hypothetical protein
MRKPPEKGFHCYRIESRKAQAIRMALKAGR